MTCKEKFEEQFPNHRLFDDDGNAIYCPSEFDYHYDPDCDNIACSVCWEREIPEKKKRAYPIEHVSIINWICKDCKFKKNRIFKDKSPYPVCTHPHGHNKPCALIAACDAYLKYEPKDDNPVIKDSGARREFETGAVRDIQEGKGRCDLLPLDVVAHLRGNVLHRVSEYQDTGEFRHLCNALQQFIDKHYNKDMSTAFLEVSKHFEEGAKKYGEYNWQKGIPTHCYIDSAVRHYLKYLRGDKDEPHDRAFVWNILCCIWTCIHKPELNDYRKEEKSDG